MFAYANPQRFMELSGRMLPWLATATAILFAVGLYLSVTAPPDYQQGETVRIMFIHVPAAWVAMMAYGLMALASLFGLINRHPLADVAAKQAAPLGALFTALALITGSLWGRPMWGTYWVWDGRLTSFLLLLFLYLGYIALWNAIENEVRAAKAAAILALIGVVNLPIIEFSVQWWTTLHQGESIFRRGGPLISAVFLWPLFIMAAAYTLLFFTLLIVRMQTEILERRTRSLALGGGA
jgi:heme exporter protein C